MLTMVSYILKSITKIKNQRCPIGDTGEGEQAMKAIYLNVNENQMPEVLDITDELETYYKLCQCTCIDIVTRKIGKTPYSIVCDDEGLFVDSPKLGC